ncbi:MAG: NAD-dependent epimerase/dehydratase family protein [Bacillota bacterium]
MNTGITGGTSGLGKRLTEYLISKGHHIKALVRKTSRVEDLQKWGAELIYGDINDPDSLEALVRGVDICYHLAAQVSSAARERLWKVNVEGTENICEAVRKYNPHCRMVFCSSIVVKGVRFYNKAFLSDYTISKYEAENIVTRYMKEHHLNAVVIYPGYIYGPYDRNFMPSILKMLKHGVKFLIRGGEKNAPVVYVDDLCELFHLAGIKDIALGKKYVSLKRSDIGIHGFLKLVAGKMNCPLPDKILPKFPLVVLAFILDKCHKIFGAKSAPKLNMRLIGALSNRAKYFHEAAQEELGWDQKVNIPEGIDRALAWQMENMSV